jgi:inorganic triphosphatase YgiF
MGHSSVSDLTPGHTEIERKYIAPALKVLDDLEIMLVDRFRARDLGCRDQVDIYYDTAEYDLCQRGASLRIRQRDGVHVVTIKTPTASRTSDGSMKRLEHEIVVPDTDLRHCRKLLMRLLPELEQSFAALQIALTVKNTRNTFLVTHGDAVLEVSLDSISYHLGELSGEEFEVELELRSDPSTIAGLSEFGRTVEAEFPGLRLSHQSKYLRGLNMLGLRPY